MIKKIIWFLFAIGYAHDFKLCRVDRKDFIINSVDFYPPHPKAGELLNISIAGVANRAFTGGEVDIKVDKFGFQVYSAKLDACKLTDCPINTGDFVIEYSKKLPNMKGKFDIEVIVLDNADAKVSCIDMDTTIS